MVYRHFYKNFNSHTLLKLYLAYVRPYLQYCSHVWSPLKGDIDIIETVQEYALRVCTKSWDLSYDDLNATSVAPLHQRWIIACLCHLHKILSGLTEFPNAPVQSKNFPFNSRLASSSYLNVPKLRTFSHGHSFFPNTITLWNNLPSNIRRNSHQSFKSNVTKYFNNNRMH